MSATVEFEECLCRAVELLTQANLPDWERALVGVRALLDTDRHMALATLGRLYGGAGSLNDLVLYRQGQLLLAENVEFDQLRERMHRLMLGLRVALAEQ